MDDDGFIKEKIDTLKKAESSCDVSVPDSLYEKCSFAFTNKTRSTKTIRRKFAPVFSACVAAVIICCITFCAILIPPQQTKYFIDDDLYSCPSSYEEQHNQYHILFPNLEYGESSFTLRKDIKNDTVVLLINELNILNGNLVTSVVLVNNYKFEQIEIYSKLLDSHETELFECKYFIYKTDYLALATFEYNNYTYYLKFTSSTPENIVDILDSFSL